MRGPAEAKLAKMLPEQAGKGENRKFSISKYAPRCYLIGCVLPLAQECFIRTLHMDAYHTPLSGSATDLWEDHSDTNQAWRSI